MVGMFPQFMNLLHVWKNFYVMPHSLFSNEDTAIKKIELITAKIGFVLLANSQSGTSGYYYLINRICEGIHTFRI